MVVHVVACFTFQLQKIVSQKPLRPLGSLAVTRIRTWVVSATTRSTNHYTITAKQADLMVTIFHKQT